MMKKALSYFAILLAVLLTLPVLMKIFGYGNMSLTDVAVAHIVSAFLFSIGFLFLTDKHKAREKRDNIWPAFVLVFCCMIPVYGIIIALVVYLAQRHMVKRPPPVVSDDIKVQDPEVFKKPMNKAAQLEILDRLDIEPFVDIFRRGNSSLKKSAVKLLGTLRSKKAVRTLKLALMDKDIEIRLFAAGVLGRIEDEFTTEIKTQSTKYERKKGDRKIGVALVNRYIDYADSGLLDSIARDYYFKEALKVLADLPEDEETLYLKALSSFSLKDIGNAKIDIMKCLKDDPNNTKYNDLLVKIEYEGKNYSGLAEEFGKIVKDGVTGIDKEMLSYWTEK